MSPQHQSSHAALGRDFVLFTTRSGAHYVFDAATASVHPWPLSFTETQAVYASPKTSLAALACMQGSRQSLATYVRSWRHHAGAFGATSDRGMTAPCDAGGDGCRHRASDRCPPPWTPAPSVLSNLMLVVTDACNLRCDYCIFSGAYDGYKTLRASRMTWDTAREGVNRFLELNDTPAFRALPDRKLDIAFFGGEPTLAADVIRNVVLYAEAKKRDHYDLHFSMTTNLTHLSEEMARFFVDHKISLQCSIDGPQPVHDRHRRYASGKGSFDRIRKNLARLRSLDAAYYAGYVQSTVTLTATSNLVAINDFFERGDPLVPPVAFIGFIREGGQHPGNEGDTEALAGGHRALEALYLARKRAGVPVRPGTFLYHYIEEPLRVLHERLMTTGSRIRAAYTGMCQPGRRIAVSTDGMMHLCERVNEHFPIGSAADGLSLDRCHDVMTRYYRSMPDCDACCARSTCTTCCAQVCDEDAFVFTPAHCDAVRNGLGNRLAFLYSLLEEVPDALLSGDPLIDNHHLARCEP